MRHDGVTLKKMPNSRILALPGVTEASGLDVSVQELSLFVADAGQGSVDVLKLSGSRSRQGLTPSGQILKLKVGLISFSTEMASLYIQKFNVKPYFHSFCHSYLFLMDLSYKFRSYFS